MKNVFLFVAAAILSFNVAEAQEFRMGAKAGVNFASIGGEYAENFDPRVSFHLGGLVEIPLTGKFAIQPELLYSSQGMKEGYYTFVFNSNIKSNLKLDYINIPIMGKYYIIENLSIEVGPQVGFLISAKNKYSYHQESGTNDVKNSFKTLDLGIGLGASYRLNNGVFFSLRFNKGLSNVNDSNRYNINPNDYPANTDLNFKNRNNVFQISGGYSF